MAAGAPDTRGSWGSRVGFVLAAAGSAVGLGNLWKFPYMAYANGGGATDQRGAGAFVLIYLAAILTVGLPIMVAEILIGRRTRRNPVGAFEKLRPGTPWKLVGALGIFTGFVLLSYYNVVAGWTVEYSIKAISNEFGDYEETIGREEVSRKLWRDFVASERSLPILERAGYADDLTLPEPDPALGEVDPDEMVYFRQALAGAWQRFAEEQPQERERLARETSAALWAELETRPDAAERLMALKKELLPGRLFSEFLANPWKQVGWALLFMMLSVGVVIGGISKGIERWTRVLMPALVLLLLGLLVRMLTLEGAGRALTFLFRPNFAHVDAAMVLNALGQAFFSLSLGMGAIITYGSYLSKRENIANAALSVTVMDTLIALVASVIIFSAIFSYGLVMKDGGAGNLFTAIPVIFLKTPGGALLSVAFYVLVLFAALTSTISLLEVVVSYLIDERGWTRRRATVGVGAAVFVIGIPSGLSFNVLRDVQIFGKTWFDLADYLCANWLLPVGGLLVALFAGWALKVREQREELPVDAWFSLPVWRFLVRWIAPAAVLAVLVGIVVGTVQAG